MTNEEEKSITSDEAIDLLNSLGTPGFKMPAIKRYWALCEHKARASYVAGLAKEKLRAGYVGKVVFSPNHADEDRVFFILTTPEEQMARSR